MSSAKKLDSLVFPNKELNRHKTNSGSALGSRSDLGFSTVGEMITAYVIDVYENDSFRLENSWYAQRASSCLLMPEKGDLVLLYRVQDQTMTTSDSPQNIAYILHVLDKQQVQKISSLPLSQVASNARLSNG